MPHTDAEPSSDLILPSAESLQQEEISRVLEARMSNGRDTPAHQDAKRSHTTPVLISDQRDHADCEDGSECWLEGKDDRAGHNDRTCPVRQPTVSGAAAGPRASSTPAVIASTLPATVRNQRFSSVRVS
jgi:hypothetical protein